MDAPGTPAPNRRRPGALALLAGGLAAVWLVLAGGDADSWPLGAASVALAAWAARAMAAPGPRRVRWSGLPRFLVFFLHESLVSGLHVAGRALRPRPALRPGLVRFASRLPDEDSRVFFANAISLMPGTLTCGLEGGELTVHVLDEAAYRPEDLGRLEDRVAELFGVAAAGRPLRPGDEQ